MTKNELIKLLFNQLAVEFGNRCIMRPDDYRTDELGRLLSELTDDVYDLTSEEANATGGVLTCAYCGKEYPHGTPASRNEALTQHIKVCEQHPLRAAEEHITLLCDVIKHRYPTVHTMEDAQLLIDEVDSLRCKNELKVLSDALAYLHGDDES